MSNKTKTSKGKTGKIVKPKNAVKTAVKTKAQGNGKPIAEETLSAPMKAGLAAVAAMSPAPEPPRQETKLSLIIKLLTRPEGATIDDMVKETSWQKHTVRAALSHALVKKHGYKIVSDKPKDGHRIYKIAEAEQ